MHIQLIPNGNNYIVKFIRNEFTNEMKFIDKEHLKCFLSVMKVVATGKASEIIVNGNNYRYVICASPVEDHICIEYDGKGFDLYVEDALEFYDYVLINWNKI